MGLFDFMNKNERSQRQDIKTFNSQNGFSLENSEYTSEGKGGAMQIMRPRSFSDVEEIINCLRENKPVIVYLNELKDDTAQRVIDLLSGAIYALKGGLCEIEKGIYVFTPDGVNVKI